MSLLDDMKGEDSIHLAERLGLSHRAPVLERRTFLKGMLGLGALVATPAGLFIPEPKIFQVPAAPLGIPITLITLPNGVAIPAEGGWEGPWTFGDPPPESVLALLHEFMGKGTYAFAR